MDRYLKCIHSLYPEALTKFNTTPGVRGEEEYQIRNKNLTMKMIKIAIYCPQGSGTLRQ